MVPNNRLEKIRVNQILSYKSKSSYHQYHLIQQKSSYRSKWYASNCFIPSLFMNGVLIINTFFSSFFIGILDKEQEDLYTCMGKHHYNVLYP